MKTLIAWDDRAATEMRRLYLSTGDNESAVAASAEELLAEARTGKSDAVLMALTFPHTSQEGFAAFQQIHTALPALPVVLACRPTELALLPRFLSHALRFPLTRDK